MLDIYNQTVAPFISASVATVPLYFAFERKTALQLGALPPKFSLASSLYGGLKAAPKMGLAIYVQLLAEKSLEGHLSHEISPKNIGISSVVVGGISAPFWAIFNGQTLGWSVERSLREFSSRQGVAIIVREAIFLASLRLSTPLNDTLKVSLGDSQTLFLSSCFISAMAGSFLSHPADTVFTLSQKKHKIRASQLMKGSQITALAIGVFAVLNEAALSLLLLPKQ